MKLFEANITSRIIDYFDKNKDLTFSQINFEIHSISGIVDFFENDNELTDFRHQLQLNQNIIAEPDRAEYGDFQTNLQLANKVCKLLNQRQISPKTIIEPTCGQGNFIITAIQNFDSLTEIYGIEIYKPYLWQTKFNILDYYLSNS